MATENFELKFGPWKAKFLERMTLTEMKIKDGTELTDEDWAFQEFLCSVWFFGMFPIYATRLKTTDEVAVDQGLFANVTTGTYDITSVTVIGTDCAIPSANQNN